MPPGLRKPAVLVAVVVVGVRVAGNGGRCCRRLVGLCAGLASPIVVADRADGCMRRAVGAGGAWAKLQIGQRTRTGRAPAANR